MYDVQIYITNHWAQVTTDDSKAFEILKNYWSYSVPGYRFMPQYKYGGWDGRVSFLKHNRVPAGLFRATYKEIQKEHPIQFDIAKDFPKLKAFSPGIPASTDERWAYQPVCVEAMTTAVSRGGGIVLSATATGKTAMAAMFFSRLPYTCLFVVDQLDLLYQSQKELAQWLGEAVGVVGDSSYDPKRVTVATIQTLHKHVDDPRFLQWYKQVQIVIVDELHEQLAHRNFEVLHEIRPIARYGLTATLQLQKKEIRTRAYAFAGPVLFEFPVAEGIEAGALTEGRVLQLRFGWQPGEYANYREEYDSQVLHNEEKMAACQNLVSMLLAHQRHVLLLVQRVAHVQRLSKAFSATVHRIAYGEIDKVSRASSREEFERGEVNLIIANQVFKKGVSIRRIDVILDMAEMKSKNDALQKFGRGLRLHPDKTGLLYIDFGTQGNNRFSKAAKSRLRAFKSAYLPVRAVNIDTLAGALKAVKQELGGELSCHA